MFQKFKKYNYYKLNQHNNTTIQQHNNRNTIMKTKTTFALSAIIAGISLIAYTNTAKAEKLPYFTMGDPTVIVKAGGGRVDNNLRGALIIEAETGICDRYLNCYNPFVAIINNTPGIGVDWVYKPTKRGRDALKLSAGFAKFDKPIENGNTTVAHLGAGFEMYKSKSLGLIVSADAFGIDEPLLIITFGVHFR